MAEDAFQLSSALRAALRGRELTTRRRVAGGAVGAHTSRQIGVGREFGQYRAYEPGDDPRRIDWKLYARSDRYFVRESEVESRAALTVWLDASASMQQAEPGGATKFERAREMAAALVWLGTRQADTVTLHIVRNGEVDTVRATGRGPAWPRMALALGRLTPGGRWPVDTTRVARAAAWRGAEPAGLEVTAVLTDGHEHDGEIRAALAAKRTGRQEGWLLHFVTAVEEEFPFDGLCRFEDWETGEIVEADGAAARAAYLAAQLKAATAWRKIGGDGGLVYRRVTVAENPERILQRLLPRAAR